MGIDLNKGLVHQWQTESLYDNGGSWIVPDAGVYADPLSVGNSVTVYRGNDPWGRTDRALRYASSGSSRMYWYYDAGEELWTDFTIAFWFLVEDSGINQNIVRRDAFDDSVGYRLYYDNKLYWSVRGASMWSNASLVGNTWYHVVAMRKGSYLYIYINGKFDSSVVGNTTALSTNNGQGGWALYGYGFNFYDIRQYDRALSDEEIWALYMGMGEPNWNPIQQNTLCDGLKHYYQFGPGYKDIVGGNDATAVFNQHPYPATDRFGRVNRAADFKPFNADRASGRCIRAASAIYYNPITIATWAYHRHDWYALKYVAVTKNWNHPNYFRGIIATDTSNNIGAYCSAPVSGFKDSGLDWTQNAWQQVVVVHSGTTATYYKNGVKGTPVDVGYANDHATYGGVYDFGCYDNATGNTWTGMIDNILIWDRALSDNEVLALYNITSQGDLIQYNSGRRLCL